jgi:tRNA (guanine-N7-)-methyltransferase
MRNNKLKRFNDLLTFPNVFENFNELQPQLTGSTGATIDYKGRWNETHFGNRHPIVLELACGGGEYTVGMATRYPETNFIGMDIKGARIWKGAKTALAEGITNAAFLRTRIEQIGHFFDTNEVQEIWITFPDPFLRNSKAKHRLTSPRFLKEYRKILQPGGIIHLKTDEPLLYEYTLEVLTQEPDFKLLYSDDDIYAKPLPYPELEIRTFYENMHLAEGKKIKYVRFALENG